MRQTKRHFGISPLAASSLFHSSLWLWTSQTIHSGFQKIASLFWVKHSPSDFISEGVVIIPGCSDILPNVKAGHFTEEVESYIRNVDAQFRAEMLFFSEFS
jgi:hypothetical protein